MTKIKVISILGMFLMLTPGLLVAETHKKVQAALAYGIPSNTCEKPKTFVSTKSVSNAPIVTAGNIDMFSGGGSADTSDIDSYTRNRLKKKEKNWRKCVDNYKTSLLEDMEELKNSAQCGLTKDQANTIVSNMLAIQNVYMTPDGILEDIPE